MGSEVQITSAGGVGYTDPFAAGEKLAIQFNVERSTSGSGTLTVTPQSSADGGISWIDKSAIVSAVAFAASAVTPLFGTDDGVTPHHDLMRLMVSTSVIANVRIFIHMRGRGISFRASSPGARAVCTRGRSTGPARPARKRVALAC